MDNQVEIKSGDLVDQLRASMGDQAITDDYKQREYFSRDLSFEPLEVADLIVAPTDVESLSKAVAAAFESGYAIVPRGGGLSYTSGYQPQKAKSMLVDMRELNNIVEINVEDMYVRVECGCTWKKLYEALKKHGVRTPYFGPLSGKYATVGGALSQNSLFLGSGLYHTVAESCIGLDIVLADGSVVTTGSAAHKNGTPFYRQFGPDMTGLFTADTGAFGIKAVATLRLIEYPQVTESASFAFLTLEDMLEAQAAVSKRRIASECYGFDPYYNRSFENLGFTLKEKVQKLGGIAKSGKNLFGGAKKILSVAKGGQGVLSKVDYSLHVVVDGVTREAVESHLSIVREICTEKGSEINNSLPIAFRAEPFGSVRTILLGSEGECWIPVHGFFPLSKAITAVRKTEEFVHANRALMDAHGIKVSYLTCFSGTEFVVEPSFYWRDGLGPLRLDLIEPEFRKQWGAIPENPEVRQIVLTLRKQLKEVFYDLGACHLQIGKYYRFRDSIENPKYWDLISGMKSIVDPENKMNPGCLGL